MKTFFVLNSDQDTMDGFDVEANTRQEALEKALSELGWYVIEDGGEDEQDLESEDVL
jgi:hypothetical protein